jgi:hypothetical protein
MVADVSDWPRLQALLDRHNTTNATALTTTKSTTNTNNDNNDTTKAVVGGDGGDGGDAVSSQIQRMRSYVIRNGNDSRGGVSSNSDRIALGMSPVCYEGWRGHALETLEQEVLITALN